MLTLRRSLGRRRCFGSGERGQGGVAPRERSPQLSETVLQRQHPVGESGLLSVIGVGQLLKLEQLIEKTAALLLELPNVADRDAGRCLIAEKELQQELVAGRIVAKGNGEPCSEAFASGRSDGVGAAHPAPSVRALGDDEAFGHQALQRRIELPIALAPEEADGLFDCFADFVAGLVVVDGKNAKDDIGGSLVFHIAKRYI